MIDEFYIIAKNRQTRFAMTVRISNSYLVIVKVISRGQETKEVECGHLRRLSGDGSAIAWRIKKLTGCARQVSRQSGASAAPWPCLVIANEWPSHARRLGDSHLPCHSHPEQQPNSTLPSYYATLNWTNCLTNLYNVAILTESVKWPN